MYHNSITGMLNKWTVLHFIYLYLSIPFCA